MGSQPCEVFGSANSGKGLVINQIHKTCKTQHLVIAPKSYSIDWRLSFMIELSAGGRNRG